MLHALLLLIPAVLPVCAHTNEAQLEKALDSVQPHHLRADLRFLSSEDMRGRETPSPELQVAALFLRSRVQRLGFTPGASNGWFYDYPVFSPRLDLNESYVDLQAAESAQRLIFGEDYYFRMSKQSFPLEQSGGVICVGEGSEEEIEDLDLTGAWALVLDRGRSARRPIERCMIAGAIGVIATPGPRYDRDTYQKKFAKRTESVRNRASASIIVPEQGTKPPVVMLSRASGARLFEQANATWEGAYPPAGLDLDLTVHEKREVDLGSTEVSNVCAFWPGSDPELAKEVMIVSAHYDHVGVMKGAIHPGADDNASGTSGLLAVAEALKAYGPMKRSVLLIWVSGEEKGLWGSKVWTLDPWLPEGCKPVLDINIDMIGRTESDELYITPSREHEAFNSLAGLAYELAPSEGFAELQGQDEYWRRSDHMNFNDNLEIPVVFLSSGDHPDYHKPTDTYEKIDYEKLTRTVRLVVRLLDSAQGAELTR
ncbi:MAG: hypothetical protein ACI8X5_000641 [Planctomycetota bacterium]|jgi:hypothetical protein